MLAGAHAPSGGEIRIEGEPVSFASAQDAAACGIATIVQELQTVIDYAFHLIVGVEAGRLMATAGRGRLLEQKTSSTVWPEGGTPLWI